MTCSASAPEALDHPKYGYIKRLQIDPLHVGGWLSGSLHGKKSTRIAKQYRLIFLPDEREHIVYLILIDPREHVYK